MTFKLLAVSAALIGFAVTGAVIPGICDEAAPRRAGQVAAASQRRPRPTSPASATGSTRSR